MSIKWWEWVALIILIPFLFVKDSKRKTKMKLFLIILICLGLYYHKEVSNFFTPKPVATVTEEATVTIGDTLSISVSGPAVEQAASAVKGVVDSVKVVKPEPEPKKDEPNWLTKWLHEHTPKK